MNTHELRLSVSLFVLLCAGCPGTLDDPTRFEGGPLGAGPSAGRLDGDAGQHDAAWVIADSGWSAQPSATDAATPMPWKDASLDAGVSHSDAAVPLAATDAAAPLPRDAGSDAGASCNFKALMQSKCGNATCHGGTGAAGGLDLTTDGLAQRVAGRRGADACSSYLLIDTATPEQSALYLKVTDHACGVRMPLGGSLLNEEQQCILQWIEQL